MEQLPENITFYKSKILETNQYVHLIICVYVYANQDSHCIAVKAKLKCQDKTVVTLSVIC